jgi:hypothetical protein
LTRYLGDKAVRPLPLSIVRPIYNEAQGFLRKLGI